MPKSPLRFSAHLADVFHGLAVHGPEPLGAVSPAGAKLFALTLKTSLRDDSRCAGETAASLRMTTYCTCCTCADGERDRFGRRSPGAKQCRFGALCGRTTLLDSRGTSRTAICIGRTGRRSATRTARSSEILGRHFPAMSVLVVNALVEPEALVEIEATAVVRD